MKESLIEIIERTRIKTKYAINQIIEESGLPAYLMEGIITGILCDIREQKAIEIVKEIETKNENEEKKE